MRSSSILEHRFDRLRGYTPVTTGMDTRGALVELGIHVFFLAGVPEKE